MALTMKEGLSIIDRVTKKAAVGHIHTAHVTAFLEEFEKAVEDERETCARIADVIGNDEIARAIRDRL